MIYFIAPKQIAFFLSLMIHTLILFVLYKNHSAHQENRESIQVVLGSQKVVPIEKVFRKIKKKNIQSSSKKTGKPGPLKSDILEKIKQVNHSIKNTIRYPELARRMHWEGTVLIAVKVSSTGMRSIDENKKTMAYLKKSSGHLVLDETALSAADSWSFPKGFLNNMVGHDFLLEFKFNLQTLNQL